MEWQPIETAPEGVPILMTTGNLTVVAERGSIFPDSSPDHIWAVGFSGYEWEWDFEWEDLTHWMPLPPAPPPTIDHG